ncbi:MAG: Fic family protein [Gemmatimonadales bacterium]|nr:Fic family protein [Gemmatimonadales bacterium]MDQ3427786.1 Fic family protein [Gemmatimonadota bacterium]
MTGPAAGGVQGGGERGAVHPFDDGNGRVARAFMNAELVSGGEGWILIPTARSACCGRRERFRNRGRMFGAIAVNGIAQEALFRALPRVRFPLLV